MHKGGRLAGRSGRCKQFTAAHRRYLYSCFKNTKTINETWHLINGVTSCLLMSIVSVWATILTAIWYEGSGGHGFIPLTSGKPVGVVLEFLCGIALYWITEWSSIFSTAAHLQETVNTMKLSFQTCICLSATDPNFIFVDDNVSLDVTSDVEELLGSEDICRMHRPTCSRFKSQLTYAICFGETPGRSILHRTPDS